MTRPSPLEIVLHPGEGWWGGAVPDGQAMPMGAAPLARDLAVNAGLLHDPSDGANQAAPLLLSDRGRVVWSERPFAFAFDGAGAFDGAADVDGPGTLRIAASGDAEVTVLQAPEATLAAAFRLAAERLAPPDGRAPAPELFTAPQYNTWIEDPFHPTQRNVLAYARRLVDAGLPPGVLMIDDNWAPDWGDWRFDEERFPDPRAMVDELEALGFRVMLWLVPFVDETSGAFAELRDAGLLLRDASGSVAVRDWWNGRSAVLDLTDPAALAWLRGRLDALVADVGIAGFKFDGGDVRDFRVGDRTFSGGGPVDLCAAWGRFGLDYPFNEYRAAWKAGGLALAQRLHDKPPSWDERGILSLIPEGLAQGLIGSPFTCADMVGGGDLASFGADSVVDQEHFVRYAQAAALFPMMQFSISPARVLDAEHLDAVRDAVALRQRLLPEILQLVDHAAATGEPIIRPLEYHHPGIRHVADQFLLGEHLLVAPVLERGARRRRVLLPPGRWADAAGTVHDGGAAHDGGTEIEVDAPLASLPWFRRVSGQSAGNTARVA